MSNNPNDMKHFQVVLNQGKKSLSALYAAADLMDYAEKDAPPDFVESLGLGVRAIVECALDDFEHLVAKCDWLAGVVQIEDSRIKEIRDKNHEINRLEYELRQAKMDAESSEQTAQHCNEQWDVRDKEAAKAKHQKGLADSEIERLKEDKELLRQENRELKEELRLANLKLDGASDPGTRSIVADTYAADLEEELAKQRDRAERYKEAYRKTCCEIATLKGGKKLCEESK